MCDADRSLHAVVKAQVVTGRSLSVVAIAAVRRPLAALDILMKVVETWQTEPGGRLRGRLSGHGSRDRACPRADREIGKRGACVPANGASVGGRRATATLSSMTDGCRAGMHGSSGTAAGWSCRTSTRAIAGSWTGRGYGAHERVALADGSAAPARRDVTGVSHLTAGWLRPRRFTGVPGVSRRRWRCGAGSTAWPPALART